MMVRSGVNQLLRLSDNYYNDTTHIYYRPSPVRSTVFGRSLSHTALSIQVLSLRSPPFTCPRSLARTGPSAVRATLRPVSSSPSCALNSHQT